MKTVRWIFALECSNLNYDKLCEIIAIFDYCPKKEDGRISIDCAGGSIYLELIFNHELNVNIIMIGVTMMVPELVGNAWDILICIFNETNANVWISTYSQKHLSQFGKTLEVVIGNEIGFLISAESFDKMIL